MKAIILASSSLSRRSLLARLELPFESHSPDVDETPLPHEKPADLALRLAIKKAQVFQSKYPDALIIGSDQVIFCGDTRLDKPETVENATQQLKLISNKYIDSHTAICLLNTETKKFQSNVIYTRVYFRELSDEIIREYIRRDNPLHCAGSIKAEGLGMALFTQLESSDPTAILGLPLITLTTMLINEGVELF
ncbi:MAG TPA: Maf family nucleotide pyrophosphatase [Gammaproteobacteria bacterium]|nr:Maf family nucleotide pyrophosphatase [Gammaproteobacteria bacterium]